MGGGPEEEEAISKILLGLSLAFQDAAGFSKAKKELGSDITPFSPDFKQADGKYDARVPDLLGLTLKACIVANELYFAERVIIFAKESNYLLSVDQEAVIQSLRQTQEGMQLENDYSVLRMLVCHEIKYKFNATEASGEVQSKSKQDKDNDLTTLKQGEAGISPGTTQRQHDSDVPETDKLASDIKQLLDKGDDEDVFGFDDTSKTPTKAAAAHKDGTDN